MAWNPSPKVASARDFGRKFRKKIVVILSIDAKGQLEYASYGETKELCSHAREIGDVAFNSIIKAMS